MADAARFSPGQRVYLNEGESPPLTVIRWDREARIVTCLWSNKAAMGQVEIPDNVLEPADHPGDEEDS